MSFAPHLFALLFVAAGAVFGASLCIHRRNRGRSTPRMLRVAVRSPTGPELVDGDNTLRASGTLVSARSYREQPLHTIVLPVSRVKVQEMMSSRAGPSTAVAASYAPSPTAAALFDRFQLPQLSAFQPSTASSLPLRGPGPAGQSLFTTGSTSAATHNLSSGASLSLEMLPSMDMCEEEGEDGVSPVAAGPKSPSGGGKSFMGFTFSRSTSASSSAAAGAAGVPYFPRTNSFSTPTSPLRMLPSIPSQHSVATPSGVRVDLDSSARDGSSSASGLSGPFTRLRQPRHYHHTAQLQAAVQDHSRSEPSLGDSAASTNTHIEGESRWPGAMSSASTESV